MSRATRSLTLVVATLLLSCAQSQEVTGTMGDGVASVSIELHIVPAGVQCLRLTASTGARVERQLFPVTAGQSTRLLVGGLPAGMVSFNGDAFDLDCDLVNGKSFPSWISDIQTATLSASTVAKVFLTFRQNVRARVSADFVGDPTFQEFPIPSGGAPYLITWGFSGDLWFTEREANRVGKITAAGVITEFVVPTPFALPEGISTVGGGDAWFTEFGANKIGHVTSAGVFQEFDIPTPNSGPRGIIQGPTGGFWFTEFNAGKIGFITTAGVITEFNVPSGAGLGRICTGFDGIDFVNMWFVESAAGKVAKIAANGAITEFNLQGAGSPFDLNYAFDGNVYVAEPGANLIARVNPVGVIIEFQPPTPNSQPFSIAQAGGPGSKIWFTERGAAKIGNMTFP